MQSIRYYKKINNLKLNNILNRAQIAANEKYFTTVFNTSKMYFWPDEIEVYIINGKAITCSSRGLNALKRNTSQKFLSNYSFIIK